MNLKNLLLNLAISSIGLVNAYEGDCNSIYNYLSKKGYPENLNECVTNSRGKVTKLNLSTYCLTARQVNSVINFKTITELTFSTGITDPDSPLANCKEIKTFPTTIENLEKLKVLDLTGITTFKSGNIESIPESLQKLIIGEATLNQSVINEFDNLSNLNYLEFDRTKFESGVNFRSARELDFLKTLKINNAVKDSEDVEPIAINDHFLKYFRTLDVLEINQGILNKTVLDEISKLTLLKELVITASDFAEDSTIQSFKNLKDLELLTIDANKSHISRISTSLYYLTKLKSLTINNHGDTEFPHSSSLSFLNLKALEYLDLSTNNANIKISHITGLLNLKNLNLNGNKITSIPRSIGDLKELETLFVSNNAIASVSTGIGNLTKLINLDLSNNKISSIPKSIGNLVNLEFLQLSSNELTGIPSTIGSLVNLTYFDLSNNPISTELPESLNNLTKITYFNF